MATWPVVVVRRLVIDWLWGEHGRFRTHPCPEMRPARRASLMPVPADLAVAALKPDRHDL